VTVQTPDITDIIDRVLDKGIVVEYHAEVAIVGIDTLVRIDARYVAASFTTYVRYAEPIRLSGLINPSIGFHR
jgi:gas vesicle structural protein